MESPRSSKSWLKNKLNSIRADATPPPGHHRHLSPAANDSPHLRTGSSLDDGDEDDCSHGLVPSRPSLARNRPVRRSNTTGASPRSTSAAARHRQRHRDEPESSPRLKKNSVVETAQNFAGDLFVAEEGLVSLQRIRNFTTKDGSLVNRGDSFRIKKGPRTAAVANERDPSSEASADTSSPQDGASVQPGHREGKREQVKFEILVLGAPGVGKSTLINQMMTSVHLAADDSYGQHMSGYGYGCEVVVKVDRLEIVLRFLNSSEALQQHNEQASTTTAENSNNSDAFAQQHPDLELIKSNQSVASGFLVVYSVTDQPSFRHAQTCLHELRPDKRRNLVILVANKNDLVRNRVISEEDGMKLATRKQCKYIDLSALLDHKVDDLLVGIARQIHIRQLPPHGLLKPRVYFDEEGNPVSGDDDDDDDAIDNDDVNIYESRAHAAALEVTQGAGTPRLNRKFTFLKPFFGQGPSKLRFDPGKFQSRVGSLVLGLFKRKHKEADKSLGAAFSGHTHTMTNLFPAALGPLKNRCDDLMSP